MTRNAAISARKGASIVLVGLIALAASAALAGAPSESRQSELIYRLRQDCGSCHGYTLKGGLGPSLLPAALKGKDNDVLVDVILHGVPGRPMPPWNFEVTRDEAFWLVRQMKRGLRNER
jgi:cytochrome c55X